jgi:Lhr-like helicase
MKLSLGRDFFGRAYDRLSPSADQSPKWYCESCSMHKNLQRDVRDIRAEFDKLNAGQSSALSTSDEFQRAALRLREIAAILDGTQDRSPLLDASDIKQLMDRFQTATIRT